MDLCLISCFTTSGLFNFLYLFIQLNFFIYLFFFFFFEICQSQVLHQAQYSEITLAIPFKNTFFLVLLSLCHILKSWLHRISTRIRTLSLGLEKNDTSKCSDNFLTTSHISPLVREKSEIGKSPRPSSQKSYLVAIQFLK